MAQFTINIPDADVPDWISAFSENYPPDAQISRQAWAKRQLQELLRGVVRNYRLNEALKNIPDSEATVT